jgi:hypothetical protein
LRLDSQKSSRKSKQEPIMRRTRVFSLPLLVVALAAGCSSDATITTPNVAQFQGTWNATSIVYTSTTSSTTTFDAFSVGARLNLIIAADGKFTGSFLVPPNPSIPITGGSITLTSTTQGNIVFIWPPALQANPPITDFTATYAISGNQLTFTRQATTFPVGHPLAGQPATLVIAMTRS